MKNQSWVVNAIWLLGQGVALLGSDAWPITLGLCVLSGLALAGTLKKNRSALKPGGWLFCSPLLTAIGVACIGSLFENSRSTDSPSKWSVPEYVIWALLLMGLFLGVISIVRAAGMRLFVASVMALELWYSLLVAFFALMSVTGDWI